VKDQRLILKSDIFIMSISLCAMFVVLDYIVFKLELY